MAELPGSLSYPALLSQKNGELSYLPMLHHLSSKISPLPEGLVSTRLTSCCCSRGGNDGAILEETQPSSTEGPATAQPRQPTRLLKTSRYSSSRKPFLRATLPQPGSFVGCSPTGKVPAVGVTSFQRGMDLVCLPG